MRGQRTAAHENVSRPRNPDKNHAEADDGKTEHACTLGPKRLDHLNGAAQVAGREGKDQSLEHRHHAHGKQEIADQSAAPPALAVGASGRPFGERR